MLMKKIMNAKGETMNLLYLFLLILDHTLGVVHREVQGGLLLVQFVIY